MIIARIWQAVKRVGIDFNVDPKYKINLDSTRVCLKDAWVFLAKGSPPKMRKFLQRNKPSHLTKRTWAPLATLLLRVLNGVSSGS